MSIVLQESHLFSGTITDNIRQCCPQASEEQVLNAATLAGAHQFIEQLPQGYNTQIGERGGSLSGGQKQRLVLACALITNPKILVLDVTKGRTVISIAHRLNTIRHCDRILVIEKGQIAEAGSHQTLLEGKEKYARLWASQT